jgi:hypothetical protein
MFSRTFIHYYKEIVPIIIIPTTVIGTSIGMTNSFKNQMSSVESFVSIIGFTGLGLITGITYPISFPLMTTYVIYRHSNN